MKNNIIQSEIDVKGSKINVVRVDGYEYISLTDLAKTQNDEAPVDVVKNWLRNKETKHIRKKIEWHSNRLLSKLNYAVHTDAIKKYIVHTLIEQQIKFVYAN